MRTSSAAVCPSNDKDATRNCDGDHSLLDNLLMARAARSSPASAWPQAESVGITQSLVSTESVSYYLQCVCKEPAGAVARSTIKLILLVQAGLSACHGISVPAAACPSN